MNRFLKLVAAALLMFGGTYVMAQQDDQQRTVRPLPENTSKSPTEPKDAAPYPSTEGVGSRPIGPPSSTGSASPANDENNPNQKKMAQ